MTTIKKLKPGIYLVNGKEVNTRVPLWGKGLTNEEYKCLKDFRMKEK